MPDAWCKARVYTRYSGRPVIACNSGGPLESIAHGATGPPFDSECCQSQARIDSGCCQSGENRLGMLSVIGENRLGMLSVR